MKQIFKYNGYVEINYQDFISILKTFLRSDKVTDRYAADIHKTITYKSDGLDIYIYDDLNKGFLFSAEFSGTFTEAKTFINTLVQKLLDKNISNYQFEWNEVDENEDIIGEEYKVKSS